jgi:hypothetical protein
MHRKMTVYRSLTRLAVFCTISFSLFSPASTTAQPTISDNETIIAAESFMDSAQQAWTEPSRDQPPGITTLAYSDVHEQELLPGIRNSTPVIHGCTPNALVLLVGSEQTEMETDISALESMGGCALHIFPPSAFIGFVPLLARPSMLELPGVEAIYESLVDQESLSDQPAEVQTAAYMWNHNYVNPAPAELPSPNAHPLTGDQLSIEPGLVKELPTDDLPSPGYYDLSRFMAGSLAVGIILPESSGAYDTSTENWSTERMNMVAGKIQAAMSWWNSQNPYGNLSFVYDIHFQVPTSYEPINHPYSYDQYWVGETLSTLGISGSSWTDKIFNYLNGMRNAYHTDWAAVVYVVDSLNDPDGTFTNGYFGYSYGSLGLIVMTYDNDGWGIGNMDSVTAHEMGHNFGAGDEYCSPGYACCWGGGQYGYLGIPNSNCEAGCDHNFNGTCDGNDSTPFSNCHNCSNCVEVNCLMRNGSIIFGLDTPSKQQVGIRDSDGDNILDPVDTFPEVTLTEYLPDPTNDNTPTWTGSTQDIPWDSPTQGDVTINNIVDVNMRIDTGDWEPCTANDGSFDETEETFSCTPAALVDGSHTIEVYAINRVGNISDIVSDTLTINTAIPPGDFDKIFPDDGAIDVTTSPILSWEASNGAEYYEYCIDTTAGADCDSSWISTGSNTSVGLTDLPANTMHYWHVRAHNGHGDTYANENSWWSFTTASGEVKLLLVDDDDNAPDVRGYYQEALNTVGVLFNVWDTNNTDTEPSVSQLSSYETVIWFTGGEWGGAAGPGATGEAALSSWLDTGKCLMLSSQDYLFDRGATSFATNYLGLDSFSNDIGAYTSVSGQSIFAGLGPYSLAYPFINYSDILIPGADAEMAWIGNNENSAALTYTDGSFRTTFFGFPWEAISDSANRQAALASFLNWCDRIPGDFDKTFPDDGAIDVSTAPMLSWEASEGAEKYEFCLDTTDGTDCNSSWISTGSNTSVGLTDLPANTMHYWQVRAVNAGGTTYANGGSWWSFTTVPLPPAGFDKLTPDNAASDVPTNPSLSWQSSPRAGHYEYCYDDTINGSCNTSWVIAGSSTSAALAGLSKSTQYEWQVRAVNAGGTTYANGGSWWSFTTIPLPPAGFDKLTPDNAASDIPTDPSLSWQSSPGMDHYEYCYDDTINGSCNTSWVNASTSASAALAGLSKSTQYEWQVRAVNAGGTTYANDGSWWNFTTILLPTITNIFLPIMAR